MMRQCVLMDHETVAGFHEYEEIVKGSRFIGWVAPITTEDEARALLERARAEHPAATHHCSAWRIGEAVRFSDDGEPGGTAGRPMLEVLLKRELENCAAVVIRYFGGTRLGAGGLVRAYSGTVAKTLDAAGTRKVLQKSQLHLGVPFPLMDTVLRFTEEHPSAELLARDYDADGLRLAVSLPRGDAPAFLEQVQDLCHGALSVNTVEE